jgi:exopolyphosphatase/guanosine-5'-triphosphate,3'-diphosphate pyrophosphatase
VNETSILSGRRRPPERPDREGPPAVVDIGSNSVRLVIYESLSRAPAVVHNEKAICAIGRDMVSRRQLHDEGIRLALEALARFRILADAHCVGLREAVATAAARDAVNGQDFVARAESAWGGPIRILSGEQEARIAAQGVLAGIPDADGLVADLGGGSLDMVTVKNGESGNALTLPFGPLRLIDLAEGDPERARDIVRKGLEETNSLGALSGRSLYAVGGVWRSFAHVDMEDSRYPLHVLHNYSIPASRAIKLCRVLARLSRRSFDAMRSVSRRRAEALPYGAVVLEELLLATGLERVVLSAYGLREGLVFGQLKTAERARDPLIAFAESTNVRASRTPAHAHEMFDWLGPLFSGETAASRRIRLASCLFADIGWRRHPEDRAPGSFDQVLTAPFAGADHKSRVLIATAVLHRYTGESGLAPDNPLRGLLDPADTAFALRLGLAMRLALALSGSAAGELAHYSLRTTDSRVLLEIPPGRAQMAGEPVLKRLKVLASSFGRKGEIVAR